MAHKVLVDNFFVKLDLKWFKVKTTVCVDAFFKIQIYGENQFL